MIHWIRPEAFLLLLPLVPVVWRLWRQLAGARQPWQSVCDPAVLPYLKGKQPEIDRETSGCPIFPVINSSNRKKWQEKILKLNPWLDPGVFA